MTSSNPTANRSNKQVLAVTFDGDDGVTLGEHERGVFVLAAGDAVSRRGASK